MEHRLECFECGTDYSPTQVTYSCRRCGSLLEVKYDYEKIRETLDEQALLSRPLSVWRYRELLPVEEGTKIISLSEGGTTLHACERLGETLKVRGLRVKNEGENPTGSFKDRGMTVGISKALEMSFKVAACASTGNTSASMSAYAAKAGLTPVILIPSGKVAMGKLAQAIVHGARIIQIRGNFDDAMKAILSLVESNPSIYLLNSINPYRVEGQKTLAFEIFHQLGGKVPDNVILPVGNAGNITSAWKGFVELQEIGLAEGLPRMIGVQAEGAAPIFAAFKRGIYELQRLDAPETVATAIRIGSPVHWKRALRAVKDSGGVMEAVSDKEILEAQRLLARLEGLFVEPAGAAPIAGLRKLVKAGLLDSDEVTVCVATGHGLKDPDVVLRGYGKPVVVDVRKESIERALSTFLSQIG